MECITKLVNKCPLKHWLKIQRVHKYLLGLYLRQDPFHADPKAPLIPKETKFLHFQDLNFQHVNDTTTMISEMLLTEDLGKRVKRNF